MQKGQTLIEVLISLGIAIIVITSITSTVLTSLNNVTFTKYQGRSAQYAQEGMEIVRQNIANVQQGDYCLDNNQTTLGSPIVTDSTGQCPNLNLGGFKRTVTIGKATNPCPSIAPGTSSLTRVKVVVSWNDSKCNASKFCHFSKEETCM